MLLDRCIRRSDVDLLVRRDICDAGNFSQPLDIVVAGRTGDDPDFVEDLIDGESGLSQFFLYIAKRLFA